MALVKSGNDVRGNGHGDTGSIIRHIIAMRQFPARRIVCLTEETVETLYLLGEQDRIVGVSGYAVRPPQVRREKPGYRPSSRPTFRRSWRSSPTSFSPSPICRPTSSPTWCAPASRIHVFNQRDIAGILAMIRTAGCAGRRGRTRRSARNRTMSNALPASRRSPRPSPKPKVYFEEWDDPLISGIGWVSELIEIAGGEDVLPNLRLQQAAKDRIISPDVVRDARARRDPRVMVRQEGRAGRDPAAAGLGRRSRPCATIASSKSSRR